jgi:GTP-binding protein HflX
VHAVLTDLGLGAQVEAGLIEALNKIDLLPEEARETLRNQARRNRDAVPVSAASGEGCDALLALLDQRLDSDRRAVRLDLSLSDGAALAWLYSHGEVLHRADDDSEAHVEVRLSEADLGRFRQMQTRQ